MRERICNPSNSECESDKPCDVRLKIVNTEKKLVDKLDDEQSESIDGNEMISVNLNDYVEVYVGLVQYTLYYLSLLF